jgi:hypothetical protein
MPWVVSMILWVGVGENGECVCTRPSPHFSRAHTQQFKVQKPNQSELQDICASVQMKQSYSITGLQSYLSSHV